MNILSDHNNSMEPNHKIKKIECPSEQEAYELLREYLYIYTECPSMFYNLKNCDDPDVRYRINTLYFRVRELHLNTSTVVIGKDYDINNTMKKIEIFAKVVGFKNYVFTKGKMTRKEKQ